ncbi:MAG: hypothetical protein ACJAT4_001390 [Granulosicoccus sp.]|jgi:hypothetical protein
MLVKKNEIHSFNRKKDFLAFNFSLNISFPFMAMPLTLGLLKKMPRIKSAVLFLKMESSGFNPRAFYHKFFLCQ